MSYFSLRNRRGFILIFAFLAITVLVILGGIYFLHSMNESRLTGKDKDSREALSMAEEGIAYAIQELKAKNWENWYTHSWNKAVTPAVLQTNTDPLTRVSDRRILGQWFTNTAYQRTIIGSGYSAYRYSYFVQSRCSPSKVFFVRTYQDYRPDIGEPNLQAAIEDTVVVVRSIGIVNGARRCLEQRVSRHSLYEYFYFYPEDKVFKSGSYDGGQVSATDHNPLGKIHVNGNIGLYWASFANLKRLSCEGKLYQYHSFYSTPEWHDKYKWDYANMQATYNDPVNGAGEYQTMDLSNAYAPQALGDLDSKFGHYANWANSIKINGVKIPFRAENTDDEMFASGDDDRYFTETWAEWPWPLYNHQATSVSSVNLTVPQEEYRSLERALSLAPNTIDNQTKYWNARFNGDIADNTRPLTASQEWWVSPDAYNYGAGNIDGLPVQGSGANSYVNVRYLDSERQASDWTRWTAATKEVIAGLPEASNRYLSAVIDEKNSGGEHINPPEPEAEYRELAETKGILVTLDDDNRCIIKIAGQQPATSGDTRNLERAFNIEDGENPFNPELTFKNPLYPATADDKKTYVLTVDVGRLSYYANRLGLNGILYVDFTHNADGQEVQEALDHDYTVRLENPRFSSYTSRVFSPLTVYSPNQTVQLKGDINTYQSGSGSTPYTRGWRPAAVITNKRIETLSADFDDDLYDKNNYSYGNEAAEPIIRPLYYNRLDSSGARYRYPYNCQQDDQFLQNYVYDALNAGVGGGWSAVGISSPPAKAAFTWNGYVKTNISDPRYQQLLAKVGQGQYFIANNSAGNIIPEARTPAAYNLALISPYYLEGYALERWSYYNTYVSNGVWAPANTSRTGMNFKGAFIRLIAERARLGANELFNPNDPLSLNYALTTSTTYSKYWNDWTMGASPLFSSLYDASFLTPTYRPPGDFYGASENSWIEINPNEFLLAELSPPTSPPVSTTAPPPTSGAEPPPTDAYVPPTTTSPPPPTS